MDCCGCFLQTLLSIIHPADLSGGIATWRTRFGCSLCGCSLITRLIARLLQAGTARALQCCCWSSVVKPALADPCDWRWDDCFATSTPRALPLSISVDEVAASCAVPWTYESRSPLLCCIPVRSGGCNRYVQKLLGCHRRSAKLQIADANFCEQVLFQKACAK